MKPQRGHAANEIEAALQHHRAGRLQQAEALYKKMPHNPDALHLRGLIAHQMNRHDEAAELIGKAIRALPSNAAYYFSIDSVYRALNRLDNVIACYHRLLERKPQDADANNNLANALKDLSRFDEAVACYLKAIVLKPDFAEAHSNLGAVLAMQGKLEHAVPHYQKSVELKPDFADAHYNLGVAYKELGKRNEAAACYLKAIALKPDFAEAFNNLGIVYADEGKTNEAIACYRKTITLNPDYAEAHTNLALLLRDRGDLDEAAAFCRRAIELRPHFAEAHGNLGTILQAQGKPDEAIPCYRKALSLKPDFVSAHYSLLLSMQYSAAFTPEEMYAEHVRFGQQFETPLKANWIGHANPRDPHKRLKIGYVSPDFRKHAVAYFIEPVLACHDKSQVEVFCYYNHTQDDAITRHLQTLADHWVPCKDMSDDQLAERIRADGVDILIDLAGHTSGTRLLAFARKPAPVQVTYLGYPATTGLTTIDYRLTDVHAEPPGMTEQFNVEQLWRLPEFFCVYRANDNSPDVIDHPPAVDNGYVTFGCFNNFAKVTDPALKLWAKLLEKVRTARLMLEIHGIDNPVFRAEVESRLAQLGLPVERVILVPRTPENQYVLYNRIDIALDPFPLNGGTTSMDAVWMGVPFVTLAGRYFSSRMGVTVLTNAGLQELIAEGEEAYVNIAAALAEDPQRLKAIRAGLRERVKASPLMDSLRFTKHMEQAYRAMWQRWCNQELDGDTAALPDIQTAVEHHRAGRLQEAEAIYKQLHDNPDAWHLRGVIAHQMNNHGEAVELITKALAIQPSNAAYYISLGAVCRALNRLDDVVACYRQALTLNPASAEAHNNLGLAYKDQGKLDEAAACYLNAIEQKPDFFEAYNNLGLVFADQGNPDASIECYRTALMFHADAAEVHNNLGIELRKRGELDEAMSCFQNALALKPAYADAHCNLGLAFQLQDKSGEAIYCYQTALTLKPDFAEAYTHMGIAFAAQGNLDDAVACHQRTLALKPDFAEAHNNLGTAFKEQGKREEAANCYLNALALKPDFAEAFNNLGIVFGDLGDLEKAEECCRRAIAIRPDFADAYHHLGTLFHTLGKPDEEIPCYRKALELKPNFAGAHHSLLLAMQYSASFTPEEMHAEHVHFGRQFETPLKPRWAAHPNSRDPNKRLKIGYVSPDLRKHAVAYFVEPILACHDKSQVEVFCYYNHTQCDPVSERLQALADHWIPCRYMTDEQLAERIRADGIDILVDLAGHTRDTRLLVFARKPAPVQVTYLGYPATTGLTAIDYRLTDVHAEPVGMTEQFSVEQLWRLPEMFCVYRAPANSPQVIDHPPSLDNGYVTFGCFNNFAKVTDPVLKLWAKLLDKVPSARLMLEIAGIDNPGFHAEVESRLARLGIPLARLILVPRKPENQYVLYNRIDIALDPFPQNGGTTSMDAVWMGVPLVTLAGRHFSSRMGVTILSNAGLPELIASSEEDYVNIAAALAQDAERLKAIRAGLRERVKASPLMNEQRFTQHLEQAYRGTWQTWCSSDASEGPSA